ncbi:MAG: hypothetical protein A3D67_03690 [Candidatus Lloydbacteria bacterium RIFCSPHIGHO2_02_FULL_51_22]|uniref:Bacterial Ig-like domain-containing protein n=3 Tax=Candidatus Lloydiibacteriota TaxID=1817910 RepID=A0A1G2DC09_9BACT|nr:MAG: hypothetical protein A3D67_03690 [Candidatus Lloydbacteria bacterium RIFCSPHIGHO2_02_FULL_51_22]OGZ16916.1 MAG: hypothetical protein A3G11_00350 [Candidatus Lloydbacteria bacterium RIFCSPLOWO2_12_FULL_51_9]
MKKLFGVLIAALLMLAIAGCGEGDTGGGKKSPPTTPAPIATVTSSDCDEYKCMVTFTLPDGYWSLMAQAKAALHKAMNAVIPMALPDPNVVSHIRVVAFDSTTGVSAAFVAFDEVTGDPLTDGVSCTQGCTDIPFGTYTGSMTVALGSYDVCAIAIGPQTPTATSDLTFEAGGCTDPLTPVVVTSGMPAPAEAAVTLTVSAVGVDMSAPVSGLNYGPNETATVTFTNTGMPDNMDSFAVFQVDGNPASAFNRVLCDSVAVTGQDTPCTTVALGVPQTVGATQFYVLAIASGAPFCVDWGSGCTLRTQAQDTSGLPSQTGFVVFNSTAMTVDPNPTGGISVIITGAEPDDEKVR